MPEQIWRVGTHQPQNVYEGDRYVGVMFNPADAARVVAAMNGAPVARAGTVEESARKALGQAGLSFQDAFIHISMGPSGSRRLALLKDGDGTFTAEQARLMARSFDVDFDEGAAYDEVERDGDRTATLAFITRDGLDVVIHREPEDAS